ncbi:MAG: ActS/PrrB/RegB family redox-sensitive histidine kinase [Pseudomonadota bacterium]
MEDVVKESRIGLNETLFALTPEGLGSAQSALGRTRMRTFIALRWMAVAGQTAAVLGVYFGLGFSLPLSACLAVIAASAWVNVLLSLFLPSQRLVRDWEAGLNLAFDTVQLAALIALTGGLTNPFLLLLVAPVTVAALILRPHEAALLALLAMVLASAMLLYSLPLPWSGEVPPDLPDLFKIGHLAALATGLSFFAVSALRVSQDEARLVRALDAASVVMAREQRLSAIGAMSAMTAHELGTPLATIHLVAKEMASQFPEDDPMAEDANLLAEQAERCRKILRQLGEAREASDIVHARMPVRALVDEAAEPYRGLGVALNVSAEPGEGGEDAAPTLRRSPEVLHALSAFIENAVSFADSSVNARVSWTPEHIIVTVSDDGPGFAPDVQPKLGEPYVSQRGEDQKGGGDMGLGFFIAKTLIEQTGGRVATRNRTPPRHGAVVQAVWPRTRLEAPENRII